jgi:ABC-type Fe3+ transport system permease subunit
VPTTATGFEPAATLPLTVPVKVVAVAYTKVFSRLVPFTVVVNDAVVPVAKPVPVIVAAAEV